MKFYVELTDDPDWELINIIYDTKDVSYSLSGTQPDAGKAKLEWQLTDTPAVHNMRKSFEQLQQKPCLNLFSFDTTANKQTLDVVNTQFKLAFKSLMSAYTSMDTEMFAPYEAADYEQLQTTVEFGDLVFDMDAQLNVYDLLWRESLFSAFRKRTLDNLGYGMVDYLALPNFVCDFDRTKIANTTPVVKGRTPLQTLWFERNKEQLEEKGYNIDDYKTNVGWLVAGKLITDPASALDIIDSYEYVINYGFTE